MNKAKDLSQKYLLTFKEASQYFGIGENKLRRMAEGDPLPHWAIHNGQRTQIKRVLFEKILLESDTI